MVKIALTRWDADIFFLTSFIYEYRTHSLSSWNPTQKFRAWSLHDKNNTKTPLVKSLSQFFVYSNQWKKEIPHLSMYLPALCELQWFAAALQLNIALELHWREHLSCTTSAQSWCQQVERIHSESSLIPSEQTCFQYWGQHSYTPIHTHTHVGHLESIYWCENWAPWHSTKLWIMYSWQ